MPPALDDLHATLRPGDLSRALLATHPGRLAVLPVTGVTWGGLGEPARVIATRRAAARVGATGALAAAR